MDFLKIYLQDNPYLSIVSESEHKEVLIWAHKKGYVSLKQAPTGQYCFSKKDLEKALMWREKDET